MEATDDLLVDNAPDAMSRAHLLVPSTKESRAWLNVHPLSSLGLCMDDEIIRVAVSLCLGTPLCQPLHLLRTYVCGMDTATPPSTTSFTGHLRQPGSSPIWNHLGSTTSMASGQTGPLWYHRKGLKSLCGKQPLTTLMHHTTYVSSTWSCGETGQRVQARKA